jgi:DNA-binding NarL/FixJ family response regulator
MDVVPNYASKTFLLIDDETFMLGLVDRILKQCQAGRVLRATNGAAALAMFNGDIGAVDCIVADLHMKPMNGLELLKAIRIGVGKRIPRDQRVIMLTGDRDMDAVRAAGELDINGYVLKPVPTENLVTALKKALDRPPSLKDAEHYHSVQLPEMLTG